MANKGSIQRGEHRSRDTEFKKGQHWRSPKPFWDRDYLIREYLDNGRSALEISIENGCTEGNILYWLDKHNIPRRTVTEIRKSKHWGLSGETNPMFGKRGTESSNWKGGKTPERQRFYSSLEWKEAVRLVMERDQGVCCRCQAVPKKCRSIHIHHVAPFEVEHLRAVVSNLATLCFSCHGFVHSKKNVNREFVSRERR